MYTFPCCCDEVLDGLAIRPDGIYVTAPSAAPDTSTEIAKRLTDGGRLIGFDRDPDAVAVATERLAPYPATVVHHNYDEMQTVLTEMGVVPVDGVLLDLGVSSHQLDEDSRGFSYHHDAPLDMRMSQTGMTARTGEYGFGTGAFPDLVYLWGRVLRPEHRPEYCAGKRGKADPHHTGTGGNHQKQRTAKGAPDEKSLQKILPGDPHCGERGV